MNFKNWAPLRFVDADLLSKVRAAYVFGKTGLEAFIITEDDEVFGIGPNFSSCLGVDCEGPLLKPHRVPELCQKNIKGFIYCLPGDGAAFIRAYTYDNSLYFWGKYSTSSAIDKTPRLTEKKESFKIRDAVCGRNHFLYLLTDQQVYSYGRNDYGQLGRSSSNSASSGNSGSNIVGGELLHKNVVKISCGASFSVAVVDTGEVFAWGSNSHGQLGIDNEDRSQSKKPMKTHELSCTIIKQITCGESYVLAVSDVGELFSWGKNDVGQLGLGDTVIRYKPTKIEKIGMVIDVAATCYGSTSAAMTKSNEVYMWGHCGELHITVPTLIQLESVFDVFALFGNPRITPRLMTRCGQLGLDSVGESINKAFGDVETSDLIIVAEGKEIFVHKVILQLRSNYFKAYLKEPWMNENQKKIVIDQKYDGMHAYLQYLYAGNFKGSFELAKEVLKIADEYNDLNLKKICENHVIQGINVENLTDLYNLAEKLDLKDLAEHCVLFAVKHMGQIVKTTGFNEWDAKTHQRFTIACYEQKLFKYWK